VAGNQESAAIFSVTAPEDVAELVRNRTISLLLSGDGEVEEAVHGAAPGSRGVDFADLVIVCPGTLCTIFPGEVDAEGGATGTTAGAPAEGKEDLALVCPGTLFTIFPGEVDVEGGATGITAGAPAEDNEDEDTAFA